MLRLSQRTELLKSSSIMEISGRAQELKLQGHDVISLAAGEPDFNTPEPIRQAAFQAMNEGITKYTPAPGFLVLREAIAEMVSRANGFKVKPEEVIITSGAKHALYLALQCLVSPGDAVLVPTPAWVSYATMIELAGGNFFPLPLFEEDGFRPSTDRWKGMAIASNVRGMILNSPNNPTGMVYSREDLMRLVSWALQRNLWIISDEIYEHILYDGAKHHSVASLGPEAQAHTITISGFSKSFCMTGWRLGWAIADIELTKKMSALQSQSTSHVTSFVQWAALTAAKLSPSYLADMVGVFEKRRALCVRRLERLSDYLSYVLPNGAFYFFVNISKALFNKKIGDVEFCKELLLTHHVALVPGASFGKEKYARLSYATSEDNLIKAFDRIEKYLRS